MTTANTQGNKSALPQENQAFQHRQDEPYIYFLIHLFQGGIAEISSLISSFNPYHFQLVKKEMDADWSILFIYFWPAERGDSYLQGLVVAKTGSYCMSVNKGAKV